MIHIAICDDDAMHCSKLESDIGLYGKRHLMKIETDVFISGEELINDLVNEEKRHVYNLIFLDIEMNQKNGIDIGKTIRYELNNDAVQIIYVSSYIEYALHVFEIQPIAFITKPITEDKIFSALDTFIKKAEKSLHLFHFQFKKLSYAIDYHNIYCFESAYNKKIRLIHKDGEYNFYDKIDNIYEKLKCEMFYKIHQGCIINLYFVTCIEGNIITMAGKFQVIIPQRKQKALITLLKEIGEKQND